MKRCGCCLLLDEGDAQTCGSCGEASWEEVTDASPVSSELLDLQKVREDEQPRRRGKKAPAVS